MAHAALHSPGAHHGHKPKKHLVAGAEDVYLYTTQEDAPVGLLYEIECARLNRVRFTLDFTGSVNFEVENGGMKLEIVAEPFKRTRMGRLHLKHPGQAAKLTNRYTWSLQDPDYDLMHRVQATDKAAIVDLMHEARKLGFGDDSLTVHEVEAKCQSKRVNFLDLDYPPLEASLYAKSAIDGRLLSDGRPITFRRPNDFMDGEYDVFLGGIEPNDIRQGMLSDCWFLCALSAIAEFPHLVKNLFLEESQTVSPHGVYKLRLCKNGQWQTVTVDDYFPCWPGGGPAYSRSHGNELWVLLLEKAYAKLHGSYAAIKMGWAYEAMLDLTGTPYATIRFEDPDVQQRYKDGKLWEQLVHWDEEGYVMSCSTPGEDIYTETGDKPMKDDSGLVSGHAYTLLAAKETSEGHKLVQLRNPWGNFEWQGDWSDHSDLWTPTLRAEVGADFHAEDDGKFWMCFDDVMAHFFSINVCMVAQIYSPTSEKHLAPGSLLPAPKKQVPQLGKRGWVEKRRKVCFTYGGEDNITVPMYIICVKSMQRMFISVHQEDERCEGSKPYLDIGVTVLQIMPNYTYRLVASSGNSAERQNQTEVTLRSGQYLVVPTTTGCKFAQGLQHSGGPPVALFKELAPSAGKDILGRFKSKQKKKQQEAAAAKEAEEKKAKAEAAGVTGAAAVKEEAEEEEEEKKKREEEAAEKALSSSNMEFSNEVTAALNEVFRRLDADLDHVLNRSELNSFMQMTEGMSISDDVYNWLISEFDSFQGGLTQDGFRAAYMYMFKSSGCDPETIWRDLIYMGYDRRLDLLYARTLILAFHSTVDFEIHAQPFDADAYEEAMELPIKEFGKCKTLEGGRVKLYTRRAGYSGVSFAVENCSKTSIQFTLDCSESRNVMSHRGSLRAMQTIPPSETKVLHHLMPEKSFEQWSWSTKYSVKWTE